MSVKDFMTSEFQKAVYSSLGGKNTESLDDIDDQLEQLEKFEGAPKKKVDFKLSVTEANQFYHALVDVIKDGADPHSLAKEIIVKIQDRLREKQKEAYGASGPKGGVFRRSE